MDTDSKKWIIPEQYKKIYHNGLSGKHIVTAADLKYVKILKSILGNLTEETYEEYFHHLLWFEECKERDMLHSNTFFKEDILIILEGVHELNKKRYSNGDESLTINTKITENIQTSFKSTYGKEQDVDNVTLRNEGTRLSIAVPKIEQKRIRVDDRIMLVSNDSLSTRLIATITDIKQNKLIFQLEKPKSYCTKANELFKLVFLYADYQNKSMHEVLDNILKDHHRSKIYPKKNCKPTPRASILKWYNPCISGNAEQRSAVEHIVARTSGTAPYILHGPPGTGKTATIVEAILQVLKSSASNKVMVCAPSNMAADDVAVKLIKYKSEFPFEIYLIRRNSLHRDWSTLPKCLNDYSKDPFVRDPAVSYEYQMREALKNVRVIVSTICYGPQAAKYVSHITHLFIDEAGQSTEPLCLLPIRKLLSPAGLLVLSGDPLQLGPVVNSPHAKKYGFGLSLMERLMKECSLYNSHKTDPSYTVMLKKNFRSHADILYISNEYFYEGKLQACAKEEPISRTNILNSRKTYRAIVFHAVLGQEQQEKQSSSYFNKMELNMVKVYIKRLMIKYKENLEDIGIITPYTSQVVKIKEWLSTMGAEKIEVGSVESFQGKEKSIILISTVRGNGDDSTRKVKLGFLTDSKRFNVALTRAKAKLIVIGNPNCLNTDIMWHLYIEKCKEIGSYTDDIECLKYLSKETKGVTPSSTIIARLQRLNINK